MSVTALFTTMTTLIEGLKQINVLHDKMKDWKPKKSQDGNVEARLDDIEKSFQTQIEMTEKFQELHEKQREFVQGLAQSVLANEQTLNKFDDTLKEHTATLNSLDANHLAEMVRKAEMYQHRLDQVEQETKQSRESLDTFRAKLVLEEETLKALKESFEKTDRVMEKHLSKMEDLSLRMDRIENRLERQDALLMKVRGLCYMVMSAAGISLLIIIFHAIK